MFYIMCNCFDIEFCNLLSHYFSQLFYNISQSNFVIELPYNNLQLDLPIYLNPLLHLRHSNNSFASATCSGLHFSPNT